MKKKIIAKSVSILIGIFCLVLSFTFVSVARQVPDKGWRFIGYLQVVISSIVGCIYIFGKGVPYENLPTRKDFLN